MSITSAPPAPPVLLTGPPLRDEAFAARLAVAKRAWTTRHVSLHSARRLVQDTPRAGQVLLARVVELGQHRRLESPHGRRQTLHVGDEVVVVLGDRYAPDQFAAHVPDDLESCHLVAGGGLASRVVHSHAAMRSATLLQPLGLLADESGRPLDVADHDALAPWGTETERTHHREDAGPVVIAVAGTAMNSGKTTAAAALVRGAHLAGMHVGAAKVTGTGSGNDVWTLADAGARPALDFGDVGLVSTYRVDAPRVLRAFERLTESLADDGCEVVVVEVADGVYQEETAALLAEESFRARVDGLVFAANDALGAAAGAQWLAGRGLAPLAFSGVVSASPLASSETRRATGIDVWEAPHLADPELVHHLVERLRDARPAAVVA
ncbi:DUF1611 domain-containing protein [Aquipuribacter sp. MA13-6]|uniref:DUF1611 domain-containing protein n=1 Tax=unclassified Aquipuribacter TaxID=2635084 RepID=UPI003EEFF5AA